MRVGLDVVCDEGGWMRCECWVGECGVGVATLMESSAIHEPCMHILVSPLQFIELCSQQQNRFFADLR